MKKLIALGLGRNLAEQKKSWNHTPLWYVESNKMSHNLGLFMLTPRFCLQPEKLKINFQFTMNSQETIVTVSFKKNFLSMIED